MGVTAGIGGAVCLAVALHAAEQAAGWRTVVVRRTDSGVHVELERAIRPLQREELAQRMAPRGVRRD
jgi:hypothetical protein